MTTAPSSRGSRSRLSALPQAAAMAVLLAVQAGAMEIPSGVGLTDPTLAFGLAGITDFSTEMPFLDLMKESRPVIASQGHTWQAMTNAALQAGGYLDANGWPTKIPPGMTSVATIWAWGNSAGNDAAIASREGVYVLSYDGQGTLKLSGDVKILSSEPGKIVFENLHGNTMGLAITATDPNGTGDYIRDISVVNEKYEALYQAGEIFNPDWLSVVQDARELRFMDWMNTNRNTGTADWADRPTLDSETWMQTGVPVEVMVQLANQTGAEPWFNMPVGATADYIKAFATYVRDHLDPGLVAHVEYANEAWNAALPAYRQMLQGSKAAWGKPAPADYYAKRATQMALIWDQVFGGEAKARVDAVLGAQTGNPWVAQQELAAPIWQAQEPQAYVAPASVFTSLAVTTYFGNQTVAKPDLRNDLLAAIRDPSGNATAWLTQKLANPGYPASIPDIVGQWARNKAIAAQYGLKLVAYEGGQHVQQAFNIHGVSKEDMATLTTFLSAYARSPEMAGLYGQLWDAWAQVGDGPFMQFGDVGAPSKWGSFTLLSAIGDHNPRAELMFKRNATTPSWWGKGGGPQYQQGVIRIAGGSGGETLTGTGKDDFLIGGAGNDVLIPGTGRDGINGGGGANTLVLAGQASDYTLTHEGRGYRLTGPGTSDFLLNIDTFRFDNNATDSLDQMLKR